MDPPHKPIYLLADSQLLFARTGQQRFMHRMYEETGVGAPHVAYIGASNGDEVQFFHICRAAMENVGIRCCDMINSCFAEDDRNCLMSADIIVLAGGDVERGWKIFCAVGLKEAIIESYERGALLIGVSAGAVQLGIGTYVSSDSKLFIYTFGLVPFLIGAGEEAKDWQGLRRAVKRKEGLRAIGLTRGSGLIYSRDAIEPVGGSVEEFYATADNTIEANLWVPLPPADQRRG